jgi:hypothetical protein
MSCCGVACGQLVRSIYAQGMSGILPGNSPAEGTGRRRHPQHFLCVHKPTAFLHKSSTGSCTAGRPTSFWPGLPAAVGHRHARPHIPAAMTKDPVSDDRDPGRSRGADRACWRLCLGSARGHGSRRSMAHTTAAVPAVPRPCAQVAEHAQRVHRNTIIRQTCATPRPYTLAYPR